MVLTPKTMGPKLCVFPFMLFRPSWNTKLRRLGEERETGLSTERIQNSHSKVTVVQVCAQTFLSIQQKHIVVSPTLLL